jgi:hypothetical protein
MLQQLSNANIILAKLWRGLRRTLLVKNQTAAKKGAANEAMHPTAADWALLFCCTISIGSIHRWLKTRRWRSSIS